MRNACAVTLATLLFTSFAGLFQTAMSGICDDIASGLVINISVPCTASSTACADTDGGLTPGGIATCKDGSSAAYWKASPPTSWTDCHPASTKKPCARKSAVCETIYLYKTKSDCDNNIVCYSNDIEACTSQ